MVADVQGQEVDGLDAKSQVQQQQQQQQQQQHQRRAINFRRYFVLVWICAVAF